MVEASAPQLATKSEFAALVCRDPAFVSRAIKSGKLSGSALVGAGVHARIDVAEAMRQLGLKLDLSQQLAQARPILPGATALPDPAGASPDSRDQAMIAVERPAAAGPFPAAAGDADTDSLADQRVEALRLKNAQLRQNLERGAREDAVAAGQLVDAAAVSRALQRQVQPLASVFDELPSAIAKPISEQFGVAYPELLIAVKQAVRRQRVALAEKVQALATGHVQVAG